MIVLSRMDLKKIFGGKVVTSNCVPVTCQCPASYNWSTVTWDACYEEGDLSQAIEDFYGNSCSEEAHASLTFCNRV